jgi:nucleoside-triphosphatase
VKVGGIVSREIRTNNNMRIGFEFIDLTTNDRNVLAPITGNGPKVGRYFVNVAGCRFAAERLVNAVRNSDVIICDEIGPMELKSREFIDSARYRNSLKYMRVQESGKERKKENRSKR